MVAPIFLSSISCLSSHPKGHRRTANLSGSIDPLIVRTHGSVHNNVFCSRERLAVVHRRNSDMKRNSSATRRAFVKSAAVGVISTMGMASSARGRAPSEQVNVGLIGVGIRGYQLHRALLKVEGVRLARSRT